MFLLGVDVETTGVDVVKDQIIEIGAVVWDVEEKRPVKMLNELIDIRPNVVPEVITGITGIRQADLDKWGKPINEVLAQYVSLARECDYIVAHNGRNFDKIMLDKHLQHMADPLFDKPWIDTLTDLPMPENMKTRKLSYMAAEHGFLNPFSHRAIFDVLTMMKILSQYDLKHIIELQKAPLVKVVAKVSFEERDKAREQGFRWDRNSKQWFIEIKKTQLEGKKYPFEVSVELI